MSTATGSDQPVQLSSVPTGQMQVARGGKGRVQIASPHFKFPPVQTDEFPIGAATDRESLHLGSAKQLDPGQYSEPQEANLSEPERTEPNAPHTSWILHGPHRQPPTPHVALNAFEEFEGWTVQQVAPTAPVTSLSIEMPNRAPTEADSAAAPTSASASLPMNALPTTGSWPLASRALVTGFDLNRTRIDGPQAIGTGSRFAAEHRRWAARNESAELQVAAAIGDPQVQRAVSSTRLASKPSGVALSVFPDFKWSAVVEALVELNSPFAAQLLYVAQQLLAAGQGRLVVAGTRRQQGTSTIAATLTRLLISQQKRVLLVDADLLRSGLTESLEMSQAGSWIDQVQNFGPLIEAMSVSRRSSAAFVAVRPPEIRKELPPFLFDYLGQLLNSADREFDAIVIDAGPVSQLLEELSQPLRLAGSLLIVQHAGADADHDLRRVKTTLNAFGIARLAVVQNFAV